jgi:hypothetical protein
LLHFQVFYILGLLMEYKPTQVATPDVIDALFLVCCLTPGDALGFVSSPSIVIED